VSGRLSCIITDISSTAVEIARDGFTNPVWTLNSIT